MTEVVRQIFTFLDKIRLSLRLFGLHVQQRTVKGSADAAIQVLQAVRLFHGLHDRLKVHEHEEWVLWVADGSHDGSGK